MVVVDASAVTELLLGRPAARRVAGVFAAHSHDLHAPHLLDVEVLSALRRAVALGDASPARGAQALTDALDLPIERHPHWLLLPRAWELRSNFSAYHAAYLALAESVVDGGAPLVTADQRLARAVRSHTDVEALVVG